MIYIHEHKLKIADAYGDIIIQGTEGGQVALNDMVDDYANCKFCTTGQTRTGCIFCGFGIKQDKDRYISLLEQEPKLCDYVMRGGAFDETDGMWKPANGGLGFWFVLEWLNVHGGIGVNIPNREHYLNKYGNEQTAKYLNIKE